MVDQGVQAYMELTGTGVMLDQQTAPNGGDNSSPAGLFAALKGVSESFETLKGLSCGSVLPAGTPSCQTVFTAPWAAQSAPIAPTLDQVDAWTDELQDLVGPIWGDLCDKAIAKTGNSYFCAIE